MRVDTFDGDDDDRPNEIGIAAVIPDNGPNSGVVWLSKQTAKDHPEVVDLIGEQLKTIVELRKIALGW